MLPAFAAIGGYVWPKSGAPGAEGEFYSVAAQVIPILFLTAAIEARAFGLRSLRDYTEKTLAAVLLGFLVAGEYEALSAIASGAPRAANFDAVVAALVGAGTAVAQLSLRLVTANGDERSSSRSDPARALGSMPGGATASGGDGRRAAIAEGRRSATQASPIPSDGVLRQPAARAYESDVARDSRVTRRKLSIMKQRLPPGRQQVLVLLVGLAGCLLAAVGAFEPVVGIVGAVVAAMALVGQHWMQGAIVVPFDEADWLSSGTPADPDLTYTIPRLVHGRSSPTVAVYQRMADDSLAVVETDVRIGEGGVVVVGIAANHAFAGEVRIT